MKLDRDVGHLIRDLHMRILVVGEDIAEGFKCLRLVVSECGLAHRVRDKIFSTQGMRRGRTRALLMRLLQFNSVIRAASKSTVAVEGPGSLALSVKTSRHCRREHSESRCRTGVTRARQVIIVRAARCEVVATASDGGVLVATHNSTRFSSFSSLRLRRSEGCAVTAALRRCSNS
jgi:hypothetical protein